MGDANYDGEEAVCSQCGGNAKGDFELSFVKPLLHWPKGRAIHNHFKRQKELRRLLKTKKTPETLRQRGRQLLPIGLEEDQKASAGMPTRGASGSMPAAVQAWRMVAPVATRSTATARKSGRRKPSDVLRPVRQPLLPLWRGAFGRIACCTRKQGPTARRCFGGVLAKQSPGRSSRPGLR